MTDKPQTDAPISDVRSGSFTIAKTVPASRDLVVHALTIDAPWDTDRSRPSTTLRSGQIFAHGANQIAVVEEGCLILEITMANGTSLCIHSFARGDYIVPVDMLGSPAFAVHYRADTLTRIGWFHRSSTASSRLADTELAFDRGREKLVRECIRLIHELACLPAPHRLYCELLRLAATQHDIAEPVLILPSQTALALRLCTSRESISRELSFLRREGVLSVGKTPRLTNRGFLVSRIANALGLTCDDEVWTSIGTLSPGR